MDKNQIDDRVQRVRDKRLAKKGITPPEKSKTKKELRQQQREALRK
jgi:hypothetical protein